MKKPIGIAAVLFAWGLAWAGAQEDDLISLARSGVDEEVLISYIDAAKGPYHLTSNQVIELKDLGVSSNAISWALKHKVAVAEAAPDVTTSTAEAPESAGSAPVAGVVPPVAPAATEPTIEAPAVSAQESTAAPAAPEASAPVPAAAETQPSSGTVAPAAPPAEMVAPAPDDQNYSLFYQSLYPYGTWIQVDGTWCWRPTAAAYDPFWSPYCNNGYWVYTDWGWTWASNYSWGWAPFHYGRWFRHTGYGWVWAPGTEWAPAWVSFRSCDGYFGWAPLPPSARFVDHRGFFFNGQLAVGGVEFGLTMVDYRFVPAGHFADRDPWLHAVPAAQAGAIFSRSAVIRNNYRFSNSHIVNAGPSVAVVSRFAGHSIDRVTIEPSRLQPGEPIRGMVRTSNTLMIYKPAISREAPRSPLDIEKRYEQEGHSAAFPAEKRAAAIAAAHRENSQAAPNGTLRQWQHRSGYYNNGGRDVHNEGVRGEQGQKPADEGDRERERR